MPKSEKKKSQKYVQLEDSKEQNRKTMIFCHFYQGEGGYDIWGGTFNPKT